MLLKSEFLRLCRHSQVYVLYRLFTIPAFIFADLDATLPVQGPIKVDAPQGSLMPGIAPARLRLSPAADVRLPVCPAFRGALGLIFLGEGLLAYLVVVVHHLASVLSLFVARVLFISHGGLSNRG